PRLVDQRWCLEADKPAGQALGVDQVVVHEGRGRERPPGAERAHAPSVLFRLLDDALQPGEPGRELLVWSGRVVAPLVVRRVESRHRSPDALRAVPILPEAVGLNVDDRVGHSKPLMVPCRASSALSNTRSRCPEWRYPAGQPPAGPRTRPGSPRPGLRLCRHTDPEAGTRAWLSCPREKTIASTPPACCGQSAPCCDRAADRAPQNCRWRTPRRAGGSWRAESNGATPAT